MTMASMYYVGLDVHKKTISFCVQDERGTIVEEGQIRARPRALSGWAGQLPAPWMGAMEATLFTGWIYDHLTMQGAAVKVAHPAQVKAIIAAKKKSDRIDARTLANLLRCRLLPEVQLLPGELRQLRRILRYRTLLVSQTTRMKNKIAGLLMESGVDYQARRLHGKQYFHQLLQELEGVPDSVVELLQMSRQTVDYLSGLEQKLRRGLLTHPHLRERVELLQSIPGVGVIVALTWALEVGPIERFASVPQAVSYCGLCSAQRESAGKMKRGPISKQRNKHLQRVLVEAAKLAPRYSPHLAGIYQKERQRGNWNRATLAVARRLVAYLLAVDRRQTPFVSASSAQ